MSSFLDLISNETIGTIEGLTGYAPELNFKEEEDISIVSNIIPPMSIIYADISGDINGKLAVAVHPQLATSLGDLMLGGEGESRDDMTDDDLDATKEIISNILGAVGNSLSAQSELPKVSFSVTDIKFFGADEEIDLDGYTKQYAYDITVASVSSIMIFIVDEDTTELFANTGSSGGVDFGSDDDIFNSNDSSSSGGGGSSSSGGGTSVESLNLSEKEANNISLIMDVKLTVKVRIGSKRMLLRDVVNMDVGSVIELNRLANDPLDIMVDDKVIGKGEVVIVDGNFGVQITEIGTKKERLEQLR
jgi:flagellar motor switch protein FliN/FliY